MVKKYNNNSKNIAIIITIILIGIIVGIHHNNIKFAFVPDAVIFRTSDLSYGTDSAIAYSDTCGNTLEAFGHRTTELTGPL